MERAVAFYLSAKLCQAAGWSLIFLRGRIPDERRNPLTRVLIALYRPLLGFSVRHAWMVCLLMTAVTAGALWLAGRAFRLGMLRYGKRLTWRELFRRGGKQA